MAETKETVSGGTLPDWEVEDLPAPPKYQFGKAFRSILGPGIIALGGSIGSGEWLLGPAITAQYGGSLLWIATIAILLQAILNTEAIRYTLYTGEPMLSGYMRCKPGAPFWASFYSGVNFFGIWPGWAMTAATALGAAWLGYMPQDADSSTVRLFAYLIFFACLGIVLFGGKIYNALEKVQLFMVIWIISYLVVIDLFMVPPRVWWTAIKGFFSFGALPAPGPDGQVNWLLLGAFAAYAGSGGLGNVTITNYVRDKGWGMSSLVGAIPSMIGGQNVTLSHWGKVFRISPENLKRFKEWWKYVRFEQYGIWMIGCFIGIALPAMLTLEFVPSGQEMDQWSAAGFQAEGLAAKGGRVMWYLTLLCGFWVLFSTQLGGVDGVPRTYTDIIWTGLKRARNLGEHNAKWIYYPILGVYIIWGIIAIYLVKPFFMILVSATIGGYLLVITALHTLYVNWKFLPPEIQAPLWKQIGLVLCAGYYSIFGTITVYQKVLVPYIFPIFG
ncbi:MAG: Nramp family divalent metal transporter [Candidatus Poribacteria bacterium]|nr:Nramp family divalent metal transporter [Candidatus Poribacteria bacterium]